MDDSRGDHSAADPIDQQIEVWRAHLRRSRAVTDTDAEELEDHLREQMDALSNRGLSPEEALLVAVRRMGAVDALTREFAREHSDRLWKQLVLLGDGAGGAVDARAELPAVRMWVAIGLALAAAVTIKLPGLFGIPFDLGNAFYRLNIAFFILPFVAAYFAWDRQLPSSTRLALAGAFAFSAITVNAFTLGWSPGADTQLLTTLHLPLALWLVVGTAYAGERWRESDRRMDFVRFSGEFLIYCVLIGMGGAVLIALALGLFAAIGLDVETVVEVWILPWGIAATPLIAAWLVEAKQSVIENIAPVLARIFAPMVTLVLAAFLVTMLWTGRGIDIQRDVLIAFDIVLLVVFGLLLYSVSARDPLDPPRLLDGIHLTLVGTTLLLDAVALWAIGSRISEFGFSPNRIAALGENVVLVGNLGGSFLMYARFLRSDGPFAGLWRWQTAYLYVFAAWAAVVAFVFPLAFGFA